MAINWTSIYDELPSEHGMYLVTCDLNMYHGGSYDAVEGNQLRSIAVASYQAGNFNIPHVIAWAKLPDVYKGHIPSIDVAQAQAIAKRFDGEYVAVRYIDGCVSYGEIAYDENIIFNNELLDISRVRDIINWGIR